MKELPKNPRLRFAPSPTGSLHVGGVRTALFNFIVAKKLGGKVILRVEDTDKKRNSEEAMNRIIEGFSWLGIDFDEGGNKGGEYGPYFQSKRTNIYEEYFVKLQKSGLVYPDDNTYRFKLPKKTVKFYDLVCKEVSRDIKDEPDLTIKREDGSFTFHFVNVVDDISMKINLVIRAEDHLSNTQKHIALFEALGEKPPTYAHIPLILNQNGSKMSKRDSGASLQYYRDKGFLPEALVNYVALLGWTPKDKEILTLQELTNSFSLEEVHKSNAKFDLKKCEWFHGQHSRLVSKTRFSNLSKTYFSQNMLEKSKINEDYFDKVLDLVAEKGHFLSEIEYKISYFFDEDFNYIQGLLEKLKEKSEENIKNLNLIYSEFEKISSENFTASKIEETLKTLPEKGEAKKREYIFLTRFSCSGTNMGPSLYGMIKVLGKETVLKRINRLKNTLS